MKAEQGSLCQREKLKGKKSEGERLCEKGLWGVSEALVSPQRLWEMLKLMHVPNRYLTFPQAPSALIQKEWWNIEVARIWEKHLHTVQYMFLHFNGRGDLEWPWWTTPDATLHSQGADKWQIRCWKVQRGHLGFWRGVKYYTGQHSCRITTVWKCCF